MDKFEEARAIFLEEGNMEGRIDSLYYIGLNYNYQKQLEEALKTLEKAVEIAEQIGNLTKKSHCLNIIGSIYREQWIY